jgi:hypothetical protein
MISFFSLVFEVPLVNIFVRFSINMLVIFVLVQLIYYRYSEKADYFFSFFLMGIIIFFVCSILKTVDIQLGMALGLFAIFSILRFRTVTYSVKDITYFFTVIGISVINSLANIPPPVIGAVLVNAVILLAAYFLEKNYQKNVHDSLILIYNKPEMLAPTLRKELLQDLSAITGQNVYRVKIHKINVGNGNAEVEVFFKVKATQ